MTRNERKLLKRTIQLGMVLTLIVIALDGVGGLDWLERLLYDYRARDCQFFMPPPTDRIVHIDIDDASLDEIGAFPWPRTELAEMVDEIRLAGAKQIAMDILFSEPQRVRLERPRGDPTSQPIEISDDANFAAAIRRAGNVMLPISIDLETVEHAPIYDAVYTALLKDIELEPDDLVAQLRGGPLDKGNLPNQIESIFFSARTSAISMRLMESIPTQGTDVTKLEKALLPRATAAGKRADAALQVEKLVDQVKSVRLVMDRTAPLPPGLPPLLTAYNTHAITIPILTDAAAYSAYPDFLSDPDGVVRRVPLFVNYRGRLFPHEALVIACAHLGVDLRQIRCLPDQIILPLPNGEQIHVPVQTINSKEFGRVGMFMNISYFGGSDWLTMYDPKHAEPAQHISMKSIWTIRELQHDITNNEREADAALLSVVKTFPSDKATAFINKSPEQRTSAERWPAIDEAIEQMDSLMDPSLLKAKFEELKPDEQEFVAAYRALKQVKATDDDRKGQIGVIRESLRQRLAGRTAIIGWSATGKTIFSTSVHPKCPGMVILGVVFNSILSRELWRVEPWWITVIITLVIGALTTLAVARLEPKQAMAATLLVMVVYFAINGLLLFDWGNRIVGAAAPLAAGVFVWSTLTLVRFISEITQRQRITARFQSYADPQLVNYVLENIDKDFFTGEVRLMTVVFTDLAGFTAISEQLRERTIPVLNRYMSLMLPIIRSNGGLWNKFLGDGIMFFYGAPQENPLHAGDAVRTALQMLKAMGPFNDELKEKDLPMVSMRVGISTGPMIVGDAGSVEASDYTVLGDEVNLGARLESANKYLGSKMLINDLGAQLCGEEFLLRPVGNICVKGKTEGVLCYEPLCLKADATDEQKRFAKLSEDVVGNFGRSNFEACLSAIDQIVNEFGASKFTSLYQSLSRLYVAEPPGEKFDGQIVLAEK